MKTIKKLQLAAAIAAGLTLVGCGSDSDKSSVDVNCANGRTVDIAANVTTNSSSVSEELVNALNSAQTCDTILIPAGNHAIATELTFDGEGVFGATEMVTNLTIKGAGMAKATTDVADKTALSFGAAEGKGAKADGFFISNTKNIIFEDLGVFEAPNNAIKLKDTDGIIIRNVATVWENDFQSTNGAYGLYPVETSNVLIEDSYVQGSADAGVYVGQSENIIVRRTTAIKNVAGIEIENSKNADVYDNIATENTGGILIFDLPIGNGIYGAGVRIFNNTITDNNAPNFAVVGGSAAGVHIVPPGTGMIVLSTSDVEIYNNTITDHRTTSIAITSFMLPDADVASFPDLGVGATVMSYGDIHPYAEILLDGWSPFVRNINIHDNTISNPTVASSPTGALMQDLINGYAVMQAHGKTGSAMPDILYDGVGELLVNTPITGASASDIPDGTPLGLALAMGINGAAAALDDYGFEDEGKQITDLGLWASYGNDDRVCQSNNGAATRAAAVYATSPTAKYTDFPKMILTGDQADAGQLIDEQVSFILDVANDVVEPVPFFLGEDDTMTCGDEVTPFTGTAAVVTFNGEAVM